MQGLAVDARPGDVVDSGSASIDMAGAGLAVCREPAVGAQDERGISSLEEVALMLKTVHDRLPMRGGRSALGRAIFPCHRPGGQNTS